MKRYFMATKLANCLLALIILTDCAASEPSSSGMDVSIGISSVPAVSSSTLQSSSASELTEFAEPPASYERPEPYQVDEYDPYREMRNAFGDDGYAIREIRVSAR